MTNFTARDQRFLSAIGVADPDSKAERVIGTREWIDDKTRIAALEQKVAILQQERDHWRQKACDIEARCEMTTAALEAAKAQLHYINMRLKGALKEGK